MRNIAALGYFLWLIPFLFSTAKMTSNYDGEDDVRVKRWLLRGSCTDHHKCNQWLDYQDLYYSCQIGRNRNKCPKSCKLCPTQALTSTHQPTTTTIQPSTTNPTSTSTLATTNQRPTTDCVDQKPAECPTWKSICETNSGVKRLCRKTCNLCPTTSLPTTTAPTTTVAPKTIATTSQPIITTASTAPITTTTATTITTEAAITIGNCVDGNPVACPTWKSTCKTNSNVRRLCKKTCNLCPTTSLPSTTAPTTTVAPKTTTTKITAKTATTIESTTTAVPTVTNGKTRSTTPTNVEDKSTAVTGTVSTDRQSNKPPRVTTAAEQMTRKTTTQQGVTTSDNVIVAGPQYAKRGISKILIVVISCIVLVGCALLAGFLYKRRKNKRNDALIGPSQSDLITMAPFKYDDLKARDAKRDSGTDCDIYDDPYAQLSNKQPARPSDAYVKPSQEQPLYHVLEKTNQQSDHNTKPSNEQPLYHVLESTNQQSDHNTKPSNEQPLYHVLESTNQTSAKSEPVYACATSGGHENQAFQNDQVIYDYTTTEGMITSSRPASDVSTTSIDTPHYHVLENPDAGRLYQALIPPVAHNEYQPIIRRELSTYEPLQNRSNIARDK